METVIWYMILSSACLFVFYLLYQLFIKQSFAFRSIRLYLLASLVFSFILPLQNYRIELDFDRPAKIVSEQALATQVTQKQSLTEISAPILNVEKPVEKRGINLLFVCLLLPILLLSRLLRDVITVINIKSGSNKVRINNVQVYSSPHVKTSYTFLKWIFVNEDLIESADINNIIAHEKIHAEELHTLDVLVIEVITVLFWLNPAIWLIRKAIKQNHEYIADEGVVSSGIDKLGYQTLLLNYIAEEKLLTLPSGLNHSLIKKRIVMMTKNKFNQKTGLRFLILLPASVLLFLGISCVNGQKKPQTPEPMAVVSPVKMNVMYLGADNPIKVAVSDYPANQISVKVTNGKIRGNNGEYIVNPERPGNSVFTVFANEKVISKTEFRVKTIPDPRAAIGTKTSGTITKEELQEAGGPNVYMANFDFDIKFEIISFVMSATKPNSTTIVEEISNSNKFSTAQIGLINSLVKNQKLIIEEIKVKAPDESIRKVSPIVFTMN